VEDNVLCSNRYHGRARVQLIRPLNFRGARPYTASAHNPTTSCEEAVKKVLVVDDSETIRLEVSRTLGQAGFSVLEARDGAEGLATAIKNPDLALLVLDVNMPVMNGLEMLERLRQNPTTADIPVLLMTTEAEDRLIERAKKAGAKGWFIKPVKPEMLLMATNKLAR
jgi:two-component system chemotaxis response regulator CheY